MNRHRSGGIAMPLTEGAVFPGGKNTREKQEGDKKQRSDHGFMEGTAR
jgi:hypothetical protein